MIFATTLAHVKAVALFTATKDVRKHINVAYAEPAADGARVVATDGTRMLVLHDDGAQFFNRANGPLCFDARAAAKLKGRPEDIVRFDGTTALNMRTNDIVRASAVLQSDTQNAGYLGRFPTWKNVVPRSNDAPCAAGFDVSLLADCTGVVKAFGGKWPAVTLFGREGAPESSIIVKFWGDIVPGFMVLMPVRETGVAPAPTSALPGWLDNAGEP